MLGFVYFSVLELPLEGKKRQTVKISESKQQNNGKKGGFCRFSLLAVFISDTLPWSCVASLTLLIFLYGREYSQMSSVRYVDFDKDSSFQRKTSRSVAQRTEAEEMET